MEMAEAQVPKVGAQKERPRSPLSGAPLPLGRQKGTPNKLTVTLKAAVERAARDCHPQGLAGWLVERANGTIGDRQIFAALVGKVIPIQVNQQIEGGIRLELGWLGGRQIGASTAQIQNPAPQALDLQRETDGTYRIIDPHTQAAPAAFPPRPTAQEAAGDAEGPRSHPGAD